MFEFQCAATPATRCIGFLCLVLEGGSWKIWVLRTVLEQLEGCENVDFLWPKTTVNGESEIPDTNTNRLVKIARAGAETDLIDCVIVGAGNAGLSCGGRLQALGVNYIILEKDSQIGASWVKRYKSARLHTQRETNHLPFNRTFSDTCSEYPTKDELVEGHRRWAHEYGIYEHIWFETALGRGSWDPAKQSWTLRISAFGVPEMITTRAVIMAVGSGGQIPIVPQFTGQADVEGTLIHSADHWSAESWKGKAGVVISSCPAKSFAKVNSKSYNANIETHVADPAAYSMPNAVARLMSRKVLHTMADEEPERFDALERAGFRCERHGDMQWHLLE
ncbi:unnamed protein product [Cercospora beticola]|nr:unnamed protein product [Cercospora beticola]